MIVNPSDVDVTHLATSEAEAGGESRIRVAKSESLNPAGKPLTIEARVRAAKPDGVILARGGS